MNKHPNGYQPKIEYWTSKLQQEVFNTKTPDMIVVAKIVSKLNYFTERQIKTYEK
jgi:hypothetical protein